MAYCTRSLVAGMGESRMHDFMFFVPASRTTQQDLTRGGGGGEVVDVLSSNTVLSWNGAVGGSTLGKGKKKISFIFV